MGEGLHEQSLLPLVSSLQLVADFVQQLLEVGLSSEIFVVYIELLITFQFLGLILNLPA